MEISKSTPYVRYRENISSTLHKGTIHIESEYLDRERKTTIESIEGQTWQNMVNGENKEEEILPRLGLKIEGNEDILDSKEQHMSIDTIIGDVEPVANEDGTYTYEISTMEGSYAKTLDGENNLLLTSDGLVGDMYIKYNAQGEEVNGNIVMNNQQNSYTIENSNTGEIKNATFKGQTLVNLQQKGTWTINGSGSNQNASYSSQLPTSLLKPSTKYFVKFNKDISTICKQFYFVQSTNIMFPLTSHSTGAYGIITTPSTLGSETTPIHIYPKDGTSLTSEQITDLQVMIIEYQDDMENWDIPYFEGMQSVTMPVLKTMNVVNLLDVKQYEHIGTVEYIFNNIIDSRFEKTFTFVSNGNFNNSWVKPFETNEFGEKIIGGWNLNVQSEKVGVNNKLCFTVPNDVDFFKLQISHLNRTEQLSYGFNDYSYGELKHEPYKSNTLTTPSDVTLRKIGDVQDELDLSTGILTQRIGEVVLDGSDDENWNMNMSSNNDTRLNMTFKVDLDNIIDYDFATTGMLCDRFIQVKGSDLWASDIQGVGSSNGSGVKIGIPKSNLTTQNVNGFRYWLSQNPVTVQYQLATESVKTVDLTIKDQDDKIIQSLHTHPSTTHINLSSDGLIPSAELSYTMYGNIGETTGEQITDGTDSKLIEGKIYGDTLLNVLPSPSLKNSMENVSMQKLNNGYDNINVADGEFKKVNLYGQTLVNIFDNWKSKTGSLTPTPTQDGYFLFTGNNLNARVDLNNISMFKRDVEYTFICRIKNSTYDGENGNLLRLQIGVNISIYSHEIVNGIWKIKKSFATDESNCNVGVLSWAGSTGSAEVSLQIVEGDYTNQDIPFFEGMQSVKMPVLMTTNTNNLIDTNPNSWHIIDGKTQIIQNKPIKVQPNTTYSFFINSSVWGYIFKCDEFGNTSKQYIGNNKGGGTFVTDDDCYYIIARNDLTADVTKAHTNKMRLFLGTKDLGYTGYVDEVKSNILTTTEDLTLRGIGDVKDTIDCLTGQMTVRIREVVLDGSQTLQPHSIVQGDTLMIKISDPSISFKQNSNLQESWNLSNMICDKEPIGETPKWNANEWNEGYNIALISSAQTTYDINSFVLAIRKSYFNVQSIDGFKTWLTQNPLTIQYKLAKESIKTVDLTITNQDNQPQTALHSIANGYINTSSQGLLPKVDYEVPTSNSYYLDMVKTDTQYTTKSSSDCNATIDGTSYPLSANGTFTTPSTITDKLMVLDAQVDDLMFIEGDLTGRKLDYFTGMQSVENVDVSVYPSDLDNINFMGMIEWENDYSYLYRLPVKGQRLWYKTGNMWNYIRFYDKNKQFLGQETNSGMGGSYQLSDNLLNKDIISKAVYFKINKKSPSGNVKIMQLRTKNSLPDIPYTDNIISLTTNEPITLHKIGDVKDELDLVNECVVRRIGKIVLDGSEDENWTINGYNGASVQNTVGFKISVPNIKKEALSPIINNRIPSLNVNNYDNYIIGMCVIIGNDIPMLHIRLSSEITGNNLLIFKQWLSKNPITVIYELATPTTEPVRIVPQNPKQSTVSLTLQSPLQKVGNVADQLRWNPYKGHYVRYNYIQDGVANSTYTFEDLKDMNERKFVNLYNQRTYIDTDHTVQVISHGISRYCLAEQGKQYQVRWDYVEQPSVDTIKVDLCGNIKEIPSSDNSVVIDVEKFTHQFIQIQGLGLTGKITNLMVIETVDGEIPDVDFFSGIQCVGNTVNIDGNTKVQIDMEQTNGNLIDEEFYVFNNGNALMFNNSSRLNIKPNKSYTYKIYKNKNDYAYTAYVQFFDKNNNQTRILNCGAINKEINITELYSNYNETMIRLYTSNIKNDGSIHTYYPFELCYADMAKDGIRPRYYDKETIILPMKLCRVGNIYDNLYYDDLKGYYRIQQSIGHKYFTGETTEVWTMETTNGYRTIKFTCTSANIDQIAYGGTICNQWKHLSTINDDIEGFIIYNGNFVLRIDKDRLTDKTVDGFKALLASSPIHLFYQLKTPQMINLTEYPNRIEFNTYRDEIFTFFKGMNPTKFTLSVPMDKTYRYEIAEEGQGLANRVAVNNETISAENVVAVKEVRGQGIANIIEDVNNVVITPRPNHGGKSTSHTLNNTKPATIRVHGFEPSGDTAIGTYNVTDKAYQLKVMSSNGDSSLSDYYVLNVPYKLETYADGTKDMVYYDEAYKQWHFKGSSVKNYTAASDGMLNETVEVFRGLAPRSGMIVEFKLRFTSGTTTARFSYSTNGVTYNSLSLRGMSDGNYLYVAFFNTGGTKIDMARKTDPNAEYELLSFLTQVPECLMVNQIQNCEFCEVTINKQYIYSEMKSPIELDTYDGTTKVFMDGNATDTNIIIRNDATTKIVNTYTDTEYTVYWKYVDGLGNLRITLGGTTVEVDGKQEYATIKTQLNAPQELLYVGGYNLSIKDLMVVKGAKINDLPYFEGSRQVGTLVLDEEGNKSYKITLVQGGSVLEQRDEDAIAFKDDNKHNVVVHKIVGVCPTKVD